MFRKATTLFLLILPYFLLAQMVPQVLVNSRGTHSIQLYDTSGTYLGDFVSPASGGLNSPEDVLVLPDGSVLVSGFGNTTIKRYSGQNGSFLGNWSTGYSLSNPSKMSIGPDSLLYITQWGSTQNKVVRFDLQGNFVDEFTQIGAPNGLGHVWDDAGNFYVSLFGQSGSGTVHKFDTAGNSLGTFISTAQLSGPTDIWWDSNGDLLVEDWNAGTILRYDSAGTYVGVHTTGLTNPEGVAFLPNGDALVGDWGLDRVHRIGPGGTLLGTFATGNGLTDPNNVTLRMVLATEIQDLTQAQARVYPTVGREFRIEVPGGGGQLQVLDTQGKCIREAEFRNHCVWKAAGLPEGIYFISLQGEKLRQTVKVRVCN